MYVNSPPCIRLSVYQSEDEKQDPVSLLIRILGEENGIS